MILQQIVNGLSIGSVYAMIAVGYSLVYSVLNFSNFAHGEILMLGSYIGFFAMTKIGMGLPFGAALGLAIIGSGIIALLIEKIGYRPLRLRKAPTLYFMISAMGFSVFLQNLGIITLSPNFRTYPKVFPIAPFSIGDITIGRLDLVIFTITIIALSL